MQFLHTLKLLESVLVEVSFVYHLEALCGNGSLVRTPDTRGKTLIELDFFLLLMDQLVREETYFLSVCNVEISARRSH